MKRFFATAAAGITATPAFAHHPLGGIEMTTFAHGLLSGLGHPVLGFDHLFFVALMGVAAAFTTRALAAPLAYVAAMLAGVVLATYAGALPVAEAVVAVSLLGLGAVVLSGRALSAPVAMALFAGFGLFHGSAFGAAMASTETQAVGAVLPGYLLGLAAVQYAIALGACAVARGVAGSARAIEPRLAGAAVAGAGLFLSLETLEGAAFGALGWG